jgi:hypothetical protein|tara:strand:- start:232 stop:387 length:156 start_codon:yes stop_codon:yes gene_type:complete
MEDTELMDCEEMEQAIRNGIEIWKASTMQVLIQEGNSAGTVALAMAMASRG